MGRSQDRRRLGWSSLHHRGKGTMATVKPTITVYVSPLRRGKVRRDCSPYLHELALVVVAWNELHLELSRLFSAVTGISLGVALDIWHSIYSDRSQRAMLLNTVKSSGLTHLRRAKEKGPDWAKRAEDDITFIVQEADRIAGPRNSAIHSPFAFQLTGKKASMVPFTFFKSRRAKELVGRDLLQEFRWHRHSSERLASFAQHVRLALYLEPEPQWPKRPALAARPKGAT
jgi:hypothetical protein